MPSALQNVACIGWGSLIWDPRTLPIRQPWFMDGPLLPVEFGRQSDDDRITLVIVPKNVTGVACVRTLWALMVARSLDEATSALAEREMPCKPDTKKVGRWPCAPEDARDFTEIVEAWAKEKGLDGVVWTALPPKFEKENGRMPGVDEVLQHLRGLSSDRQKWRRAEEYVRKAPVQIDTEYRHRIECELGWTPLPMT